MKTNDSHPLIDRAAEHALEARRRIERAVEDGRVPVWVLEACEAWEQAALAYGAAMARREFKASVMVTKGSQSLH
jgi:hypothetical protein